jgi:2-(1,2-epoxy-1,2-dihydrophenyl)acetyl-CoA isomerase
VLVERESGITTVYLNRPHALNALDGEMVAALLDVVRDFAGDDQAGALVIAGKGKAFCAGGDLGWVARSPGGSGAAIDSLVGVFHQTVTHLREVGKPVIAAIGGVAAGGGLSLALACDFRVLHRDATLRLAYPSAGLSMDGGSSFMLPRLVGQARALEIAAFDEPIAADRALTLGLVTMVTDSDVVAAAAQMGERLCRRAQRSFTWSKQLLNASFHSALDVQLTREQQAIVECIDGLEGREGVAAFIEKRRPDFAAARSRGARPVDAAGPSTKR